MKTLFRNEGRESVRGQILVMVGVGMLVFLGFTALVTDIGLIYFRQIEARSVTDTAALAGAQQLHQVNTRVITPADYSDARERAWESLTDQLDVGGAAACSSFGADIVGCPVAGTEYVASIQTDDAPITVYTDPERSILVSVIQEDVPSFFSRIFGQDGWNVRQTSVAGVVIAGKYAVMTLRPPHPTHPNTQDNDIQIGGNTALDVTGGDIGSNTTMTLTASSSDVFMDPSYKFHHLDPDYPSDLGVNQQKTIFDYIRDPNYTIPLEAGRSLGDELSEDDCNDEILLVPDGYELDGDEINDMTWPDVTCYTPGRFTSKINVPNGEVALLTPGVYYLGRGIDINNNSAVVGGYEPSSEGVALVFRECDSPTNCSFKSNASSLVALNAGNCYPSTAAPCTSGSSEATAAIDDVTGLPVQTNGIEPSELPLTLVVEKDPGCYPAMTDPDQANCAGGNKNATLSVNGGGGLYIAGVQYGPSDNVQIIGGSGSTGYAGQIISWTVQYSGGARIGQFFPGDDSNGILRLDAACSGAGPTSMSDPACKP